MTGKMKNRQGVVTVWQYKVRDAGGEQVEGGDDPVELLAWMRQHGRRGDVLVRVADDAVLAKHPGGIGSLRMKEFMAKAEPAHAADGDDEPDDEANGAERDDDEPPRGAGERTSEPGDATGEMFE